MNIRQTEMDRNPPKTHFRKIQAYKLITVYKKEVKCAFIIFMAFLNLILI